jgi:hypothetical protein
MIVVCGPSTVLSAVDPPQTVILSTGLSFGAAAKWHENFDFSAEVPAVGDFNGDCRDGIALFKRGANGDVLVSLSSGAGFGGAAIWHDLFGFDDEVVGVGNFNGTDSRDDVVVFTRGGAADALVATGNGSFFVGTGVLWNGLFASNSRVPLAGSLW